MQVNTVIQQKGKLRICRVFPEDVFCPVPCRKDRGNDPERPCSGFGLFFGPVPAGTEEK